MICLLNRSTIEKAPNWDRVALAHTPNTHVSDNRTKLVPPWGSDYCTSWSSLALFLLFPSYTLTFTSFLQSIKPLIPSTAFTTPWLWIKTCHNSLCSHGGTFWNHLLLSLLQVHMAYKHSLSQCVPLIYRSAAISLAMGLRLELSLIISGVRCVIQLTLMVRFRWRHDRKQINYNKILFVIVIRDMY